MVLGVFVVAAGYFVGAAFLLARSAASLAIIVTVIIVVDRQARNRGHGLE